MRYIALACDYDGTLAKDGKVSRRTIAALERVVESGRKLILVTGRELDDLRATFKRLDLFERIVVENGGVLYHPATKQEVLLGVAPPEELVAALRARKVKKLSVGRSILATWEPHQTAVLEAIHELGLDWQVIFNKDAVMALPPGVTKASGLHAALDDMGLSVHNVVGVGDAENDHAFLGICECSVAVANALSSVKKRVDLVTNEDHGAGVAELIESLLEDDLAKRTRRLRRHDILVGVSGEDEVSIAPSGTSILVAGPSGSGKSTATTAIIERLAEAGYQFCLVDPEGDYESFAGAVTLGSSKLEPNIDEALQLLAQPGQNVVLNLLGVRLADRPDFFTGLLPRLQELRVRTGRPHWIVVDEAHHLLPVKWKPAPETLPKEFGEMLLVTVHPDWVAPSILSAVNTVIAVGDGPDRTLAGFAKALRVKPPKLSAGQKTLEPGEILLWRRKGRGRLDKVAVTPAKAERRRHRRKYAEGEIVEEEHFFFQGPDGNLNLRAHNLIIFMQIADGVDDETWDFHLRRGDYTSWFRHVIKDGDLADAADAIATNTKLTPKQTRERIRDEVETRYTLPA